MEKIEILFEKSSVYDSKSILNRLNKPVNKSILDKIEQGVTLEDIELMTKSGIPVLRYKTQITIHGLFDELSSNYIFGYKNIFQNKNKSIGVKYTAIDEEKRQRMSKRLKCLGFNYRRNSQNTEFEIVCSINKDNFEETKSKLLKIKNNIDTSLFYGSCHLWVGSAWGIKYLILSLYINAIYERNIEPFLNGVGATKELLIKKEEAEKKEAERLEAQYKKEAEDRTRKQQESAKSKEDQVLLLQTYPKIEKTNKPGLYILREFDCNDNLVFKVVYIYLIKGKQKPRYNHRQYDNVNEALNHKATENYSDSIYNGRLSGHKIA
jgi:hypothetical protein